MIYLQLFWVFLQIGAVSFGGGYAMISMIRDQVLAHGWLREEELINMIAVSESTPGPIAVNMATFVGSSQGGLLGAIIATLGVVLPSFVIILLIAMAAKAFLSQKGVQAFLRGVRPCVVALIFGTGIVFFMTVLLGFQSTEIPLFPDYRGLILFEILLLVAFFSKVILKRKPTPVVMILISAGLGMMIYAI
ncbi:MAG: chromate transporter [Clostridia bacterium]|nr:chromate transporter [Clostridia bacterium]